jgi:hypothetical protein
MYIFSVAKKFRNCHISKTNYSNDLNCRKDHPSRVIKKPKKYITSSEETVKKIIGNKENNKNIEEDINNIRRKLNANDENANDENVNLNHLSGQVFTLTPLEPVVVNDTGPVTPKNTTEIIYTPLLPSARLTGSLDISGSSNIVSKSNCQSFENFGQPRYDTILYEKEQHQYAAPCTTISPQYGCNPTRTTREDDMRYVLQKRCLLMSEE